MPLSPGHRLGPYEIVAPLGDGGMGEVYRAKDTRLARDVAVKVLPQHLSSNPEIRARFEREAMTVSSLNHPHICTLHDVGREGDVDYLVLELIDGETLAARLAKGALPLAEVLRFGAQIADALDRAHRAGVMHRDLKPGNVMLTRSGAKLMDFGLSRATGLGGVSQLTTSPTVVGPLTAEGTIVGTFQYMAPEQLEGREADARADLWALGCVLYEMASGKRAFEGTSQASLIASIMHVQPAPLSQVSSISPPALERLVQACLAKDPADRIQSAHDVKLQLSWIAEGASQTGPTPAVVVARNKKTRWMPWALAGAGVAIAAAALLALGSRTREVEPIFASIPAPAGTQIGPYWANVSLSPDGRSVAIAAIGAARTSLWIRPVGSESARALPDTDAQAAGAVFWSDDSRSVAYFSADRKLMKVAIDGGSPVMIAPSRGGRGGAWNRDGVVVFAPAQEGPLMRVSSGGGEPQPITTLDAGRHETAHRFPCFLPDGDHFLYVALPPGPEGWDTFVGSLKSKAVKKIMTAGSAATFAPPGYLVFAKAGRVMAQRFDTGRLELTGDAVAIGNAPEYSDTDAEPVASASKNGRLIVLESDAAPARVQWLDRGGVPGNPFALPAAPWGVLRLSPDGRRAGVTNGEDIWVVDLQRGIPVRLASTNSTEASLVWSPDGNRIAYVSKQTGRSEIYVGSSDGSGSPQMLPSTEALFKYVDDWSPDGKYLVMRDVSPSTGNDLWVLPMDGGGKPVPLLRTPYIETDARVSPDGRWLAYGSNESGSPEVYVQSFPQPGHKIRISGDGGILPSWSRGGKELLYVRDGTVMSVPVEAGSEFRPGEPKPLFKVPNGVTGGDWMASGDRVLMSVTNEAPHREIRLFVHWAEALTP